MTALRTGGDTVSPGEEALETLRTVQDLEALVQAGMATAVNP